MENENRYSEYIGRMQESVIEISADRIRGLAALLDYPDPPWPGKLVPPTGHWCALFPATRQSALGDDGHEPRGDFIPPIAYPLRMWAGGRIDYRHPLRAGTPVTRRSTIIRVEDKQGRSGGMTIVTVRHEYLDGDTLVLVDEQDIVYRDALTAPLPAPVIKPPSCDAASRSDWSAEILPDSRLLFRYSAVTFNAHRIHYDQDYARKEGYPGILVHGPLTATYLVDLFQSANPGAVIRRFAYTARSPMYAGFPFTLYGRREADGRVTLWAESCDGTTSMTAVLEPAGAD